MNKEKSERDGSSFPIFLIERENGSMCFSTVHDRQAPQQQSLIKNDRRRQWGITHPASPPVATAVTGLPSDVSSRSSMPSAMAAAPSTTPLRRQSSVLRLRALSGAVSSGMGSPVRCASASAPTPTPGAMAPPRKAPLSSSTEKVVAVPMSISTSGGVYWASAPSAAAIRSAPRVSGCSMRRGLVVLAVSPTTSTGPESSAESACRSGSVTAATTLERMAPSKPSAGQPFCARESLMAAIYPAASRRRSVISRMVCRTSNLSMQPSTMLLLPASTARIMPSASAWPRSAARREPARC